MQELINNLYFKDFGTQIIIYSIFLLILIYMAIYFHFNLYINRSFEFKTILKLISPMVLFSIALTVHLFYSYKDGSYALNVNNKDNYSLVRKGETVDFISHNKRLQNAELKVEAENENNIYLEYKNTIFKIPKNEIRDN